MAETDPRSAEADTSSDPRGQNDLAEMGRWIASQQPASRLDRAISVHLEMVGTWHGIDMSDCGTPHDLNAEGSCQEYQEALSLGIQWMIHRIETLEAALEEWESAEGSP